MHPQMHIDGHTFTVHAVSMAERGYIITVGSYHNNKIFESYCLWMCVATVYKII
jgi:hypothetical protein